MHCSDYKIPPKQINLEQIVMNPAQRSPVIQGSGVVTVPGGVLEP